GDGVAVDGDVERELAVHAVIAEQVGVGFDRAEVVGGNDLDVGAAAFDDGAQDIAADAAKAIDCDANSHDGSLADKGMVRRARCLTTAPSRLQPLPGT